MLNIVVYVIKSRVHRETNRFDFLRNVLKGLLYSKVQNDILKSGCDERGGRGGVNLKAQNTFGQKWASILCQSTLHAQPHDGSKTHGWGQ